MIKTQPRSYLDSLRAYAEQWTPEQLREAILDEKVTIAKANLSDVAKEHSRTILALYEEILESKTIGKDFQ
jgi:hypothetical protein